jgi:hypothetical protein
MIPNRRARRETATCIKSIARFTGVSIGLRHGLTVATCSAETETHAVLSEEKPSDTPRRTVNTTRDQHVGTEKCGDGCCTDTLDSFQKDMPK